VSQSVPSIKDVARLAGVSAGTVSNVFSGNRPVTPELAAKVREAAQRIGYQPDRAASQLRAGKARVIGVLVPELTNPFFTSLIAAIEAAAAEDGFDILVASSGGYAESEAARLATLLAWKPAGVVIVPSGDELPFRAALDRANVPFVLVDRVPEDFDGDAVQADNEEAGRQAARHLIELGHREVVVVASSLKLRNIRERCASIEKTFLAQGRRAPALIELGFSFETATERLAIFMRQDERPTAFLALTNFATLGVLATLQKWDIEVPDDVSVLGFDDYSWMQAVSPPLTAIRQPLEEMGRQAWRLLSRRIADRAAAPMQARLACRLVRRRSTAPPSGEKGSPADATREAPDEVSRA